MSVERVLLLSLAFAALVVAHLVVVFTQRAAWPIIQYSMFASLVGDDVPYIVPFGVVTSTSEEIALVSDSRVQPFVQAELRLALAPFAMRRDLRIAEALQDILSRYEAHRTRGDHDGPALRGVKLYTMRARRDPRTRGWSIVSKRVIAEHYPS